MFRVNDCFFACINFGIQIDNDGSLHPFLGTGGGLAIGANVSVGTASRNACDRNPSSVGADFVPLAGFYGQVGHPNDLSRLDFDDTEFGVAAGASLKLPLPGLVTGPTYIVGC